MKDEEKKVRGQIDFAFEQGRKQGIAEANETVQAIRDQEAAKRVRLEKQIATLLDAAKFLISLKDEKEKYGPTAHYKAWKEIAWKQLRESISATQPAADAFVARIEAEAAPQWQPIETAPTGELLLVFQDMTGWCIRTQGDEGMWYDEHDNYDDSELEITHWMQLPDEPPSAKERSE